MLVNYYPAKCDLCLTLLHCLMNNMEAGRIEHVKSTTVAYCSHFRTKILSLPFFCRSVAGLWL